MATSLDDKCFYISNLHEGLNNFVILELGDNSFKLKIFLNDEYTEMNHVMVY